MSLFSNLCFETLLEQKIKKKMLHHFYQKKCGFRTSPQIVGFFHQPNHPRSWERPESTWWEPFSRLRCFRSVRDLRNREKLDNLLTHPFTGFFCRDFCFRGYLLNQTYFQYEINHTPCLVVSWNLSPKHVFFTKTPETSPKPGTSEHLFRQLLGWVSTIDCRPEATHRSFEAPLATGPPANRYKWRSEGPPKNG